MNNPTDLNLKSLLKPRESVFESRQSDTVLELKDMIERRIDAREFFSQHNFTQGMTQLINQGFRRLSGQPSNGVFLLRQSMGGGKTHSLLTFGLLAGDVKLRNEVLNRSNIPHLTARSVGSVQVVAFSGRDNPQHGIWGEIASQLGDKQAFNHLYSPLQSPGQQEWEKLLQGRTALILLDELVPYLDNAASIQIGASNLARVTTTALTNLMGALQRPGCEKICLVITDLGETAYRDSDGEWRNAGENGIQHNAENLAKETKRLAITLEPVQLNSNELYDILRTRLFEDMPAKDNIEKIAQAIGKEINRNELMRGNLDSANNSGSAGNQMAAQILDSYPFHPSTRDLYARFKDNPGFQQTRALIRIMRQVTKTMWENGDAEINPLIGLHNLDLNNDDLRAEITQINSHFDGAIARDIAGDGKATAEITQPQPLAKEAATLLLMSSLASATEGIRGLTRNEVSIYLSRPGVDIAQIPEALKTLEQRCWYLHRAGEQLRFDQIMNLNAEISHHEQGLSNEAARKVIHDQLYSIFAPNAQEGAYQEVMVFPRISEIPTKQEHITLILSSPMGDGLNEELQTFYQQSSTRNRLMFLTGDTNNYRQLQNEARRVKAINDILIKHTQSRSAQPIIDELTEKKQNAEMMLLTAASDSFTKLHYPQRDGLTSFQFTGRFGDQEPASSGTKQITKILTDRLKYIPELRDDHHRRFSQTVFTSSPRRWEELLDQAANTPGWIWTSPGQLEAMRRRMLDNDEWHTRGADLIKGPKPKEPTVVAVDSTAIDRERGVYQLRVRTPQDSRMVVHQREGDTVTTDDPKNEGAFQTSAKSYSFLAVDPSGQHPTGNPFTWKAPLWGSAVIEGDTVTFKGTEGATLHYSTDGTHPERGQSAKAGDEIKLPRGTRQVLIIAEKDGERSEQESVRVTRETTLLDAPGSLERDMIYRGTSSTSQFLERASKNKLILQGASLIVEGEGNGQTGTIDLGNGVEISAEKAKALMDQLREIVDPEGNLHLDIRGIRFELGQNLVDWVTEEGIQLKAGEVKQ